MLNGVSVIVCCYNSSVRLSETLRHLAQQQVAEDIAWEILLIDNASTDDTLIIARREWEAIGAANIDFKILSEPAPGKNQAFEKGIREARFSFLLTCDDDNWLNPHYVATAYRIMEGNPMLGALGGNGILRPEEPVLLNDNELAQVTVHGSQSWAGADHWVYGAGSLYRTDVLLGLLNKGWRPITAGRTGTKLSSGEDVELCFAIYLMGYQIAAEDQLVFQHFVPHQRQTEAYILDLALGLSYSYYLLYGYLAILSDKGTPLAQSSDLLLLAHLKQMTRKVCKLAYQALFKGKSASLAQKKDIAANYGMVRSIIANKKKVIRYHQYLKDLLIELH